MIAIWYRTRNYSWSLYAIDDDKTFLVDDGVDGTMTLTNAAEEVVKECRTIFGKNRIIYLGTDGLWTELKHDGNGHLTGYEFYDVAKEPIPVDDEEDEL